MIIGITVRNFKAIRQLVNLPLKSFHVLVGANASGKSTFLDVFYFVRDCLEVGPLKSVLKRGIYDFDDLTYMRQGGDIEIEFMLNGNSLLNLNDNKLLTYKIIIGKNEQFGAYIKEESLGFTSNKNKKIRRLLGKYKEHKDYYFSEERHVKTSFPSLGVDKSALAFTPSDKQIFPTANATKRFLMQGMRFIKLNSQAMGLPCPALMGTELALDGTNLAKVVGEMIRQGNTTSLAEWTNHLRYALPDLEEILWDKRAADNAEFLVLKYRNGLLCPSWLASDGTLRMLALTIMAFLPMEPNLYMVEEPENGVHPKALEIILNALRSIPKGQIFIATHSPLLVQQVEKESLLCFSMGKDGCHIVPGDQHPVLKDWQGEPDLATIFSAGILE